MHPAYRCRQPSHPDFKSFTATVDRSPAAIMILPPEAERAQLAQAQYKEELTKIRMPMDGKIIRRYANPRAGASTLNVSIMFDLEPVLPHIVRAEIVESAMPDVGRGCGPHCVATRAATGNCRCCCWARRRWI